MDTIMWAARKMRVGRTLEASWEDAGEKLVKRIEDLKNQPPKPDPEMIKAQAQKEVADAKAQGEMVRAQADVQVQQAQFKTEQLQGQIDALKLQLEAKNNAEQTLTDRQKAMLDYLKAVRVAEINAGVQTDESQIDARIEVMLGLATIQHEATQNELDRQHEAGMAQMNNEHQQHLQDTAPKPNGKAANN